MSTDRLRGKVAIITGAGSGVGQAGARIFGREGAKVVVGDIEPSSGKETVKLVKDAGGEATFVKMDGGKISDVRRLVDTTVNVYGKLDILWSHAGIPGPGRLEDTEEAEFDRAMDVNLKGPFFCAKYAAPYMIKAGGGSIIFTASGAALRSSKLSPSYAAAKGGLIPFTMSLAVSLAQYKIRANCICPGFIDSPMCRIFVDRKGELKGEALENAVRMFGKNVPMERLARPEEIAYAALFLASDEASYITGAILPVDGGMLAK
jgi:NAD(P)-dependent dehydrogenase (short-subunit alcohol dehydrogenase family)